MLADAHTHFFSPSFFQFFADQVAKREPGFSLEDLAFRTGLELPETIEALADRWVAEMDRHGVDRAVMIASVANDQKSVITAAKRHPERIVPFAMFDPTQSYPREDLAAAAVDGLVGVCLFPAMHHYPMDDRLGAHHHRFEETPLIDFVETAAEYKLVVFVHCGVLKLGIRDKLGLPSPFDLAFSNPISICRAAQHCPGTPFIIPHFGAGFFREALLLAAQCDNVYLDTSSSNSWIATQPDRLTLRDVFVRALDVVGPRRLLFGTDSNVFPRGWVSSVYETQHTILAELGLSTEDQDAILGGNLLRILDRSE